MKLFIVLILAAAAYGKPSGIAAPVVRVALAAPVATQYHSQDELGQYSYGYANEHSAKAETRSLNGITVGGYTYVDPQGKLQTVEYSSDVNGFRVAASNLPVAPAVPVAPVLPVPVPVHDTPEVVEARAKHLEALEAAKVHSAEVTASVPAVSTVVQGISPIVTGLPTPLATAPLITGSPLIAAKSVAPAAQAAALPAAPPTEAAALSTEPPTTPATVEPTSTSAPSAEAKSAIVPGAGAGAAALTPAGVSVLSVPTLGVRSLVAPTIPIGVAPVVPAPAAYSLNSIYPYGFTSIVSQPAVTAYTAQYVASVPGSLVKTSQAWSPAAGKAEQGSE